MTKVELSEFLTSSIRLWLALAESIGGAWATIGAPTLTKATMALFRPASLSAVARAIGSPTATSLGLDRQIGRARLSYDAKLRDYVMARPDQAVKLAKEAVRAAHAVTELVQQASRGRSTARHLQTVNQLFAALGAQREFSGGEELRIALIRDALKWEPENGDLRAQLFDLESR